MANDNKRGLGSALGSLFGVIGTSADAIAKTVDTTVSTIDVLEYHATRWRAEAKQQTIETLAVLKKNAHSRVAAALAEEENSIKKRCAKDSDFGKLYAKHLTAIKEIDLEELAGMGE